jgi:hypothetical protein
MMRYTASFKMRKEVVTLINKKVYVKPILRRLGLLRKRVDITF